MRPQRFDIPMGCPAGWFLALVACLFMLQTASGWAHRSSAGTDTSGISIPSLSHGEMAVIAHHRKPIPAPAGRMTRTAETIPRLVDFTNIQ